MSQLKYFIMMVLFISIAKADSYSDYLKKGDELYKGFDNLNALKNYEEAYKLAPDNYDVLLKLTRTYNDVGEELKELKKRDEAEKYINSAMKFADIFKSKYPDSAAVYAYLAFSYGNYALYVGGKEKIKLAHKIKDNATKALKMKPNWYLPYVILGIYNREIASLSWIEKIFANTFFGDLPEGSFEESEKMFYGALKLRPGMIVAMYQLSKTYRETGDEKKEKDLLNKVLQFPTVDFRDKFAKEKAKIRLEDM